MVDSRPEDPGFSVIVVTWNRVELLRRCLESLRQQIYRRFEVIVVDNASADGTDRLLADEYSDFVRVVTNPVNQGFAGGTNAGLALAKHEWIALLNNDAEAEPDWLFELARAIRGQPDVGMLASKIRTLQDPTILDNTGLCMYRDGLCRGRGRNEVDRGQYDGSDDVLLPSGCAAVYRHSALVDRGGLDEEFFCYCDDSDLGLGLRIAGHRCVYVPTAVVRHAYSGSAGAYSELKAYLVERNRIWLVVKNFPIGMMLTSIAFTFARYAAQLLGGLRGQGAYAQFARGNSGASALRIVSRAYWHALLGLPAMWKRRRQVWSRAALSKRELRHLIARHRLSLRQISFND